MSGETFATVRTVLVHAFWAIGFWLPIYAAGRVLAVGVFRAADLPARRLLHLSLGLLFWIALVFSLAGTRTLYPAPLTVVAAAALVAWLVILVREYCRGSRPAWRPASWPALEEWLPWLAVAAVLAVLFLRAILPWVSHDAQVYHLQVPKTTLSFHGFRRLPYNVYSHWPMNVEQLFTLAMAWKDYRLATTVHFALGVFTLLAMHGFCRRQSRPAAGPLAIVFFLMNGVVLQEMSIAYIDIGGAFFFFLAFWFVVERLLHPENGRRSMLIAGMFIGLMAGTKLTGFVGGVCLGLLFLIASRREGRPLRRLREMTVYLALPGFLLLLPWLIKSTLETRNPVYPFLYSYLGGIEWNQRLSEAFYRWHHDAMGTGRTWLDYLLLPWRLIVESAPRLSRFGGTLNYLWLALLPATWFGRRLPVVRWSLLVSFFYFVVWSLTSQQTRFLIPILPFLSVAAALSLHQLAARVPWPAAKRALTVTLATAVGAWLLVSAADQPREIGLTNGQYAKFLRQDPREHAIRCLNKKLPPKARVMVLQHNRCFFIERRCIADSFYAASQINEFVTRRGSFEEMKKRLQKMKVTHLLKGNRPWSIRYPRDFEAALADPAQAQLICQDRKYRLYELIDTP